MKKLIFLLLALAIMLGCMAFTEGVDYTGNWVLTGIKTSENTIGPTMLASLGMDGVTLTIHVDGASVLALGEVSETYTWAQSEDDIILNNDDNNLRLIYHLEVLYFVQDDEMLIFTREGAAPAIDETLPAESIDYTGVWVLTGC